MTKSSNYGKLFVFEGPDGSGKTTLSSAFAAYLNRHGQKCDHFSYPGQQSGTIGKLIYSLHHDPKELGIESLTPTSLQILHIAAHVDAIESKIEPALRVGRTVVLDRYWWSTWVYGKVADVDQKILRTMIRLEQMYWGKTLPAMAFLLERKTDVELENDFSCRLSTEYRKIARHEARRYPVKYIKNVQAVEEVLAKIIRYSKASREVRRPKKKAAANSQTALPLEDDEVNHHAPLVFSKFASAKPSKVFDTYWKFACERQSIFFKRVAGHTPPWTRDPVLQEYKFTNAYRASDRVSQYLIRNVIYRGDQSTQEVFFRVILFKIFNKISTWELLNKTLGSVSFADYSFDLYDKILSRALASGDRVYSAAYIMPSGGRSSISARKHQMHLKLLGQMMDDELPARIVEAPSMKKAFELLRSYPTIGDFLAYQFVTDLNYSPLMNFSEMDFVVPGPGARDGIRKCFGDLGELDESDIIRLMADRQEAEFEQRSLTFKSLWGRRLQLIDCQNLFCEVDKYSRVQHPEIVGITGRTRIKQKYRFNPSRVSVWYPPKWGLNDRIISEGENVSSI